MKRLLGLLLVMGMVGVGGGDEGPPAGDDVPTATPKNPPAQVAVIDPVAELENLRAKITQNDNGEVVAVNLSSRPQVTDAGLANLKGLTNLQKLDLTICRKISDAGLVHLRGLTNLQKLYLAGTKVTDAGLVHLKGFTNLKNLGLSNTKITRAEIAELQMALPNCRISY